MGLTSALNTAANGLVLNETSIDVLGNNIANANTNGFKASNVLFATQLSRTLSVGSRPTTALGGTNPRQIGLGATVAAINKDFTQGSVTNSTSPSDLAIQGEGFFVVSAGQNRVFTRNGNFLLNNENVLVNNQGLRVQGYAVDENFQLITTQLSDLRVPLRELNVAEQTQNVVMSGALMSTGTQATRGAEIESEQLFSDPPAVNPPVTPAGGGTLLSAVRDDAGANVFTVGQTLSFAPRKGGRTLEAATMTVAAGTTLNDLAAFMNNTIGIHSGGSVPNDGATGGQPGVTITAGGRIQIVGNQGTTNDLSVSAGDLTANGVAVPMSFDKLGAADGESTITDLVVYDSLGAEVNVKMTAALESRTPTTTTFRWYVDSPVPGQSPAVTNGTVTFDANGEIVGGGLGQISLTRFNTAAVSPMPVTLDFRNVAGISPASAGSAMALASQDGAPPGTLVSFSIDETGTINGVFDNGAIRTMGQVVLARFSNTQGLIEGGGTTFVEGVASGPPFYTTAGSFGAGSIRSSAIELSNTDIGRSLVDLIVASTNYRGNARVISSVQQLVDELLVLGR